MHDAVKVQVFEASGSTQDLCIGVSKRHNLDQEASYELWSVSIWIAFQVLLDVPSFVKWRHEYGRWRNIVADTEERQEILVIQATPNVRLPFEPLSSQLFDEVFPPEISAELTLSMSSVWPEPSGMRIIFIAT